ncbi:transposase [Nonomuraea fuscirosea]|uniref:transposase n=1 Tax=Nonomuraea fuscirosea TaxID=1291556 RepID=UPI0033DE142C
MPGRPRLLSPDDEDFVAATATIRPAKLGQPFTIGREALRTLLARRGITFQRTKTWKDLPDPDFETKLDQIEYALTQRPERTFAFDEFGPLGIRPTAGTSWAPQGEPDRLPATYHRTHGVTYFPAATPSATTCCGASTTVRKGSNHTWAALKSIRAARPDGAPIYVILDNLSAHKNARILAWAKKHKVRLLFAPT